MAAIRRLEASNEQLRTVTQHHGQLVSKLTVLEATAAHLLDDMTLPLGESNERPSSSEAQVAAPAGAHSSARPGCQSDRPESPDAHPQRSTWPPLGQPAPHKVHAQQPRHGVATPFPRVLAITAGAVCVALMIGIVLFGDSGAISVQPRRAPSAPSPVQQEEALAALGNYEEAAMLYRQALEAAPDDVSLWYALGVVLSRLNQWKDTEEAFHYVVRYGEPDAGEVKVARQWLVHRGVLAPSVPFTAGPPPSEPAASTGVVQVKATWDDLGPNAPSVRLRILLHGLSRAATGQRFSRRIALGQLQPDPVRDRHGQLGQPEEPLSSVCPRCACSSRAWASASICRQRRSWCSVSTICCCHWATARASRRIIYCRSRARRSSSAWVR